LDFGKSENQYNDIAILSMKCFKKSCKLNKHKVSVCSNSEQYNDLGKLHGIDLDAMLTSTLINETITSLNREFTKNVTKLCDLSYSKNNKDNYKDKLFNFLYKLFNKQYIKYNKVKDNNELMRRIFTECNRIAVNSRYGPGNYIIVSAKTGCILQELNNYIYSKESSENIFNSCTSIYPIGTISNVTVYVDPYMKFDDTSIYIGRKIKESEPGITFVFNENETSIQKYEIYDKIHAFNSELLYYSNFIEVGNNPENNFSKIVYKIKNKYSI
jgi:hypothetical protein